MKPVVLYALAMLIWLSLCMACEQPDYDPINEEPPTPEEPIKDVELSATCDWNMIQTIPVRIIPSKQGNSDADCTVAIYTASPVSHPDVKALVTGSVRQGQDFVTDIEVTKGEPYVYVA